MSKKWRQKDASEQVVAAKFSHGYIVKVDMLPGRDRSLCESDNLPILVDGGGVRDFDQCDFVACGNILANDEQDRIMDQLVACPNGLFQDRDVIPWVKEHCDMLKLPRRIGHWGFIRHSTFVISHSVNHIP